MRGTESWRPAVALSSSPRSFRSAAACWSREYVIDTMAMEMVSDPAWLGFVVHQFLIIISGRVTKQSRQE